jgi:hypothetical protein
MSAEPWQLNHLPDVSHCMGSHDRQNAREVTVIGRLHFWIDDSGTLLSELTLRDVVVDRQRSTPVDS